MAPLWLAVVAALALIAACYALLFAENRRVAVRVFAITIVVSELAMIAGCYAFALNEFRVRPPSLGWSMATVWMVVGRFLGVLAVMNVAAVCWWWGFRRATSTLPRTVAVAASLLLFLGGAMYFFVRIALGLMMQY